MSEQLSSRHLFRAASDSRHSPAASANVDPTSSPSSTAPVRTPPTHSRPSSIPLRYPVRLQSLHSNHHPLQEEFDASVSACLQQSGCARPDLQGPISGRRNGFMQQVHEAVQNCRQVCTPRTTFLSEGMCAIVSPRHHGCRPGFLCRLPQQNTIIGGKRRSGRADRGVHVPPGRLHRLPIQPQTCRTQLPLPTLLVAT